MKIPYQSPDPSGTERAKAAKDFRDLTTEVARLRPHALSRNNGEEEDHGPDESGASYPANFTKGLLHNQSGVLDTARDYHCFVEAINSSDRTLFDKSVPSAEDHDVTYHCYVDGKDETKWRGWESPRSGHVFELEGPDPGSVGMAPAPRVGSSELAAEMAEVYSLALLRDVPFTEIANGGSSKLCEKGGNSVLSASDIVGHLNHMPFFSGTDRVSSTVHHGDETGLNAFERNRRRARTDNDIDQLLTTENVFRGSTEGAMKGPYVSQFMLAGSNSLLGGTGGTPDFPGIQANFDAEDGFISYGSQVIDQRAITHKSCLDYMTNWSSWLDVQNGANFKGADQFEAERRFITTPRDLATYVHYDALYQAYLNACLMMLGSGVPASKGFPEPNYSGHRDAFATFGGPHILSLVTEVATRCLKAVRRQKFNYHRRCRPEALGGRLSVTCAGKHHHALGCAADAFEDTLNEIPIELQQAISEHNALQNTKAMKQMRRVKCDKECFPKGVSAKKFSDCNLLLPMAFPEGSPMHPAYGAGHATVAGGCVTMLKAFFEMYDPKGHHGKRILKLGDKDYLEPNADGTRLENKDGLQLTVQDELDKLAANISIGRNMAGVHFYSDYYDSLRMGERIAVGILMEQAPTYLDEMSVRFDSFDKDHIVISGEAGSCASLSVFNRTGDISNTADWWLRHVPGEEVILDF